MYELRLRPFVVNYFHCHEMFLCSKLTSFLYYVLDCSIVDISLPLKVEAKNVAGSVPA